MPILKVCEVCKKEFFVKPRNLNNRFCCSKKCQFERFKKTMIGKNNPNYKNAGQKICAYCGKDFKSYNKKSQYCSVMCSNEYVRERNKSIKKEKIVKVKKEIRPPKIYFCARCNKPKDTHRKSKYCKSCRAAKKIICKCVICNSDVASHPYRPRKICSSKECRRKRYSGENNPNYIDGRKTENSKIRDSLEYKNWRVSIFKRDNFSCVFCGQIGGTLHADHILSFSEYPEFRLSLENGRTLCVQCHKQTNSYCRKRRPYSYEERLFVDKIIDELSVVGWTLYKNYDLICGVTGEIWGFSNNGIFAAIFIRPPNKKDSRFLNELNKAGGIGIVCRDEKTLKELVDNALKSK